MADAFADWPRDANGQIKVNPVMGWDSFVPFGMACGLRVHFAGSEQELLSGKAQYLPLVLTPTQARELAQVLLRTAETAERKPGSAGS